MFTLFFSHLDVFELASRSFRTEAILIILTVIEIVFSRRWLILFFFSIQLTYLIINLILSVVGGHVDKRAITRCLILLLLTEALSITILRRGNNLILKHLELLLLTLDAVALKLEVELLDGAFIYTLLLFAHHSVLLPQVKC